VNICCGYHWFGKLLLFFYEVINTQLWPIGSFYLIYFIGLFYHFYRSFYLLKLGTKGSVSNHRPVLFKPRSHQVHACRTHETHKKISYVSLCAQLLSIFWRSYSEFAVNVQRTASALVIYRMHTQHVHCVHAKIWKIRAHPGCLWEVWEKVSIGEAGLRF